MEGDVPERAREAALDELGAEGHPPVDIRAGEAAAFESGLTGTDTAQVGTVETTLTEDALAPAREKRLQTLVERLASEVAPLEGATIGCEPLERGAAEVRVADRHTIQRQNALHALAPLVCCA